MRRFHGRRRAAGENATMESFFALMQKVPNRKSWTARKKLRPASLVNRTHLSSEKPSKPLGRLTLIEVKTMRRAPVATAA